MSLIQTLRKPRISVFDMRIAVFDLSLTLIGGYVIGKQLGYNPCIFSVGMIPLGIVVHQILGIETEISKKITE
jgi:F0F1-type ATP synthase assembly protein I